MRIFRILPFAFFLFPLLLWTPSTAAQFTTSGCDPEKPVIGTIHLPDDVLADGKALPAGTYQVRLTTEHPAPAPGQRETSECWVEFVANGTVVGREVATVIPPEEIDAIAKGPRPPDNAARIDLLKGGEYLRVWLNHTETHYVINLPVAAERRP